MHSTSGRLGAAASDWLTRKFGEAGQHVALALACLAVVLFFVYVAVAHPPASGASDFRMVESLEYESAVVRRRGRSTEIVLAGADGKEYRIEPWLWVPRYRGDEGRGEFLSLLRSASTATIWHRDETDREGNYFVKGLIVSGVEFDPARGVGRDKSNRRWMYALLVAFALMGVWSALRAHQTRKPSGKENA